MTLSTERYLLRTPFERDVFAYWDGKRTDILNLDLGEADGFYHHHFAVGDFDRSVLDARPEHRQAAIAAELHRMETEQVTVILQALGDVPDTARVLDAGSGRGGTSFLIHQAFGCRVDGANISSYQNAFARNLAAERGLADQVQFHDRNMADTGFPDASFDCVISNETTMYVDVHEVFAEFSRLLNPGGRYVLLTWCVNDAVPAGTEAAAIDVHYHCITHRRSTYIAALLTAGFVPYQVDDLTAAAIPYWELRSQSELATGIEGPYLKAYRSDRVNYMRIAARKAHPGGGQ